LDFEVNIEKNELVFIDHYGVIHGIELNNCTKFYEDYSLSIDPRQSDNIFYQKRVYPYIYHPLYGKVINFENRSFVTSFEKVEIEKNQVFFNSDVLFWSSQFQIQYHGGHFLLVLAGRKKRVINQLYFFQNAIYMIGENGIYLAVLSPSTTLVELSGKLKRKSVIGVDSSKIYFIDEERRTILAKHYLSGTEEEYQMDSISLTYLLSQNFAFLSRNNYLLFYNNDSLVLCRFQLKNRSIESVILCALQMDNGFLQRLFFHHDSKGKSIPEKLELALLYEMKDTVISLLRTGYDQFAIHPFYVFSFDTSMIGCVLLYPPFWSDLFYFRYDPYTVMYEGKKFRIAFSSIKEYIEKRESELDFRTVHEIRLILSFFLKDTTLAMRSIEKLREQHLLNDYHLFWFLAMRESFDLFTFYKELSSSNPIAYFLYALNSSDIYSSYRAIETYLEREKDSVFRAYATYWKAFLLIHLHDLQTAKKVVKELLEITEKVPQFWELLADIAYLEEDYQEAVSLYSLLIDRFGEDPSWYQKRGVAFVNFGKKQQGCADLWYAMEKGNEIAKLLYKEICD